MISNTAMRKSVHAYKLRYAPVEQFDLSTGISVKGTSSTVLTNGASTESCSWMCLAVWGEKGTRELGEKELTLSLHIPNILQLSTSDFRLCP